MPRTKKASPKPQPALVQRVERIYRGLHERTVVVSLLVLALVTRLLTIAKASIWHDEGFTMMLVNRNPLEIWVGSGRDVHPPLYYELLHFWTSLFGRSEFAARSMSAVAGVATLYVCYLLVRRYFSRLSATIVLLILAVAPFLVRYSQEARMYGLLGLFLITGTYALLRALESKANWRWWLFYAVMMAAGLYTHYFTALVVVAQWLYLMTLTPFHSWRFGKTAWLSKDWWLANLGIVLLWLPWLPSFYGQFTRGQGISWIPKSDIFTLPNNIWQNLTFTDGRQLPMLVYWFVPVVLIVAAAWVTWHLRKQKPQVKMVFLYTFVPIILTIVVSVIKPVYQDRYLVFAANGMYMMLGIALGEMVREHHRGTALVALASLLAISVIGVTNVARQASHSMGRVGEYVGQNYQTGDELVSAELYTYFDFTYYCQKNEACRDSFFDTSEVESSGIMEPTVAPVILKPAVRLNTSGGRPNGYGESALLFDRADAIYVDNLALIRPTSGRVWLIGKPGDKPYWKAVPANWRQINEIRTNSSEARLYQVQ